MVDLPVARDLDLEVIGKTNKTGTKVSFKPGPTLFTEANGGVQFVHETLINRLRELAFLNAGVEIVYEDERVGKRDVFRYDKGLTEYVQFLNEGKTLTSPVLRGMRLEHHSRWKRRSARSSWLRRACSRPKSRTGSSIR